MDSPSAMEATFARLTRMRMMMGMQCNVRCTMCYQTDFSPKFNMDPVIYRERLRELYPHLRSVKLIGGEPTVMKNVRETAQLLREYPKIRLNITTNGIFIDDFWIETLTRQGKILEVSINAATEAAYNKIVILGNYKKVVANLERILAKRTGNSLHVRLTAVVLKDNVFELAKLIQLGADLGVDHVSFIADPILSFVGLPHYTQIRPELELAWNAQMKSGMSVSGLDAFEALFQSDPASRVWSPEATGTKKMCAMPFNNIAVDWDGDVRVCGNTWVSIGNLYKSSLSEIWNGRTATEFRQKMRKGNYSWCSPTCEDNAKPTGLALVNKYVYRFREDPWQFVRKVHQKASQLLGTWVKVKNRRTTTPGPPPAPKPVELLPILQASSAPIGAATCSSPGGCSDD